MQDGWQAPTRRGVFGLAAGALAAPVPARPALAQATQSARFPSHPLRLFVPWTAGSSSDVQMRSLAELAQQALGQPVVIENRPGASGTLHVQPLAAARPDGYTLGQMHLSIVRRPFLVRQPAWDTVADFTHIIRLCGWMYGVAVKADSPWQDWRSFIAYAKANPGKVTFATSGIATTNHLAMEDLAAREGCEFTHVPYRGSSEGMTAVLSGQVHCIADSSVWVPQVEAGQMRALCVWTADRVARLPGVPTLQELGHDLVITSPYGMSGPKGMDPGVVRALHDAFKAALFSPANTAVRGQFDMPEQYLDSEAYADFITRRAEYERGMVQRLGIRLD
jgi:tripartite-type tricarboxylate transporter receptor subunit TctC